MPKLERRPFLGPRAVAIWWTRSPVCHTLDDWAGFIRKYQDRVLWGSDTVIYTRNQIDDKGNLIMGKEMSVEDYLAVKEILKPLWEKVGPEVVNKVRYVPTTCACSMPPE